MDMHGCDSSQIAVYGYDPDARKLRIRFHKGGTYEYSDVPIEVFEGFLSASSKGSYHYHNIKKRFSFEKLS